MTDPLGSKELSETARHLVALQRASGMVPLALEGGADPWNHVEAAIALDLSGHHDAAARAYGWLLERQQPNGSWFASYGPNGRPRSAHVDTNAVAYVATGVLCHLLVARDEPLAGSLFDMVSRALDFVVALEAGSGHLPWCLEESGFKAPYALLAGSSSATLSLRHGSELAALFEADGTRWLASSERIAFGITSGTTPLADKSEFAMDWYYPVLSGLLRGDAARRAFELGHSSFVTANGVLCRSDHRWVTTAETAEAAIAALALGERDLAAQLLVTVTDKRRKNGAYLTGLVYPERSEFPAGEESSYSSAAVLIAADALAGGIAASLFSAEKDRAPRQGFAMSTLSDSVRSAVSSSNRPDATASR